MLYKHEASFPQAVDALLEAIHYSSLDDKNVSRIGSIYGVLGETYHKLFLQDDDRWEPKMYEAWELSKQHFRIAMEAEPDNSWHRLRYGRIVVRQGKYFMDESDFTKAWTFLETGLTQYVDPALEQLRATNPLTEDLKLFQKQRFGAWQVASDIAMRLRRLKDSLRALEPALQYYRQQEAKDELSSQDDSLHNYAQALYSQGDLYMKFDQFVEAQISFQKAREYYQRLFAEQPDAVNVARERYEHVPLPDVENAKLMREQLELHQKELDKYNELLQKTKDSVMATAYYESATGNNIGKILAAMGWMYVMKNELDLAETHLRQALPRLSNQVIDDKSRRELGDVHMNLSITLNRQGQNAESAEHRALACHFYQKKRNLGFGQTTKKKKGRR
ncbi:hypothetical protein FisN_26Hu129 [Fistulifera solaris]|uniref:Tetratricopeptide repeat protein n=1 Tax=Fistulifera solaris TaxID=1519565 RepID=A0A1Z5JYE0_FISSO|nr:hypothetical protein FisN_26Hu129 [Fistulifera solaris]|eukprot:GAX18828.1 hypothetical protein FisN_26Hu129 [Fistulifera solaris]